MRQHANVPREYEMMCVFAPTLGDEGLPGQIERVSGYVTEQGGTVNSVVSENPWGRRRLAYEIDDHRDAFYVLYRFVSRAESIFEIERELKLDVNVIRYLLMRYDEMTEHEERPPRQQQGEAPGGPSFRRPRAEAAPAPAEAPAAESEAKPAEAEATDAAEES